MTKNGQGLAEYAIAQLGRPYWWGTFGQRATPALLAQKRQQYPDAYSSYGSECAAQYGQRAHDCVGLIKGYLWSDTPDSAPSYDSRQDVAVSGLYDTCTEYGSIGTMPEELGVCVFMANMGHVGVYIGNGEVVEAMGHAYGVVKTKLSGRGWAYWGKPRWISYDGAAQPVQPAKPTGSALTVSGLPLLRFGDKSEAVRAAQLLLIGRGYSCDSGWSSDGADGEFGLNTCTAVKNFQNYHGLEVDGVIGPLTWAKLIGG